MRLNFSSSGKALPDLRKDINAGGTSSVPEVSSSRRLPSSYSSLALSTSVSATRAFTGFFPFFVLLGAEALSMVFLVAIETFHRLAPICGFFFGTGRASFGTLLPLIGSGPIGTRVHCIRVWNPHLDSQDPC